MNPTNRLEAIEARLKAATPGPWKADGLRRGSYQVWKQEPDGSTCGLVASCKHAALPSEARRESHNNLVAELVASKNEIVNQERSKNSAIEALAARDKTIEAAREALIRARTWIPDTRGQKEINDALAALPPAPVESVKREDAE